MIFQGGSKHELSTYKKSSCHVHGSVDMMKWCLWFILIFVEAGEMVNHTTPELTYATPMHRTSRNGRSYTAFEGIHYRPMRYTWLFRSVGLKESYSCFRSVPHNKKSNRFLNSLDERVDCIHLDPTSGQVYGRRDCGFLNVYTPNYRKNVKMPVLIWIHGMQLSLGTDQNSQYDPRRFMDHDIVFVTMSYRLDATGFARSYFHGLIGNYGLDDQRVAIEWVTKNIENFGGDPTRITLAGHGAGAAHVIFHLKITNWAPGGYAIKRGIAISGTRFAPWIRDFFPFLMYDKFQAKLLKTEELEGECSKKITAFCLGKLLFLRLAQTSRRMMLEEQNMWKTMTWPFKPAIGHIYQEPGHELPYANSNFTLLLGLNRNEGDIISAFARERNWTGNWKDTMFRSYIDADFHVDRSNLTYIKGQMEALYEQASTKEKRVSNLMSDGWFFIPAIREAAHHNGPLKAFMFDFKTDLGLMNCKVPRSGEGTSHGDELPYIFTIEGCLVKRRNEWVAMKYVSMLANFVIDGDIKLKKYPDDRVLYDITDQLKNPENFTEIDNNLMLRLTQWKTFY